MGPIVIISLYQIDSFGVRNIYSYLRSKNIDAYVIFLKEWTFLRKLHDITEKENDLLVSFMIRIKPAIVGISIRSVFVPEAKLITDTIKKILPDTKVIWGGTHPTIDPDGSIMYCDGIVIGEGEKPMAGLITTVYTPMFYSVKNTWVWKDKEIIKNTIRELNDLDELPFQDFDHYHKVYITDNTIRYEDPLVKRITNGEYTFMASRGCPYNCTYCSNRVLISIQTKDPRKFFRWRNVDLIIEELKQIKKRFNIKSFSSNDEVFILNKQWFREFSEKYFKEINLPFRCQVHPNDITEENLKIFKGQLHITSIYIGIQSGNEKTRLMVYKRNTPDNMLIDKAMLLKKYNILAHYDFIIGNPLESHNETRYVIELLLKFPRPFGLNLYRLRHLPGTELTKTLLEKGLITESDIDGNNIKEKNTKEKRSYLILSEFDPDNRELIYYNNLAFLLGTIFLVRVRHKIYAKAPVPTFVIHYFMSHIHYYMINSMTPLIKLHTMFYSSIGQRMTAFLEKVDSMVLKDVDPNVQ